MHCLNHEEQQVYNSVEHIAARQSNCSVIKNLLKTPLFTQSYY